MERFGSRDTLDLSRLILVLPGGRAGRRLQEMLVESAETRGMLLRPPKLVTVGHLPELLYPAKRPFADDLVQQLAWVRALGEAEPQQLKLLSASVPAADDLAGWLGLGAMLGRLHRELAAEALDFQQVAEHGDALDGFCEEPRWRMLASVQDRYLRVLDGVDLWDRQTARLFAIEHGECHTEDPIVLVGTADMNRVQQQMLDQVAGQVTALVFAPEELADRFDAHGCLRPEAWQDVLIDLSRRQIEIAGRPAEQASAAIRAIAGLEGRYAADQITIGVPDERLVPYLQQQLERVGPSGPIWSGHAHRPDRALPVAVRGGRLPGGRRFPHAGRPGASSGRHRLAGRPGGPRRLADPLGPLLERALAAPPRPPLAGQFGYGPPTRKIDGGNRPADVRATRGEKGMPYAHDDH